MPKSAVINFDPGERVGKISLKKLALFFDNIFVSNLLFENLKMDAEYLEKIHKAEKQLYVQDMEWLIDNGIITTYRLDRASLDIGKYDSSLAQDVNILNAEIERNLIRDNKNLEKVSERKESRVSKIQFAGVLKVTSTLKSDMEDMKTRIDALRLSLTDKTRDFVPVINSFHSYENIQTTDLVLDFVLNKIPVPASNVAWEEIIDFRNDEDVRRKYYALIDWANEMSRSEMPLSHIADKYNQLYSEYIKQYNLHKIASEYTTVELLVAGTFDLVASLIQGQYISAFKNLIHLRSQKIALLQEERNIQGRELAYIHVADQKFS